MMKNFFIPYIGITAFAVLSVTSCKVIRPYEAPPGNLPGTYRAQGNTDTSSIAILPYTQIFNDTILQGLITQGISQNLDLQVAYTRIRQAQAYYQQSQAAFLP